MVVDVSVLGVELGGVDDEDVLPLADMDDEVEVSLDGVEELLELLGEDVSVDAVVVGGVVAAVVVELLVEEPGVALVPELL